MKVITTISIDDDVATMAQNAGIVISAFCNEALKIALAPYLNEEIKEINEEIQDLEVKVHNLKIRRTSIIAQKTNYIKWKKHLLDKNMTNNKDWVIEWKYAQQEAKRKRIIDEISRVGIPAELVPKLLDDLAGNVRSSRDGVF